MNYYVSNFTEFHVLLFKYEYDTFQILYVFEQALRVYPTAIAAEILCPQNIFLPPHYQPKGISQASRGQQYSMR